MDYLYHIQHNNMKGDILYPLNMLREVYPEVYEQQVKKYAGREQLLKHRIPILNCLWNDVLHFSAVNPVEIKKSLMEAGDKSEFKKSFYRFDPKLLEPENTVIFLYTHTNVKDKLDEENFILYNPDKISEYSLMPQATKDYYKEMISEDKRPLLYHRIPHILYKGVLNTAMVEIVSI